MTKDLASGCGLGSVAFLCQKYKVGKDGGLQKSMENLFVKTQISGIWHVSVSVCIKCPKTNKNRLVRVELKAEESLMAELVGISL